ncbi:transposase [Hujiaoplasma nucleasis]|uniref:Transposase n=2 Tax=Hujiaoplasma nucleasis TaxID=2725268 RepID=A0A7L6N4G4_9MOLU|nr:transposase [Hujiaoplasma nucleasis]
MYAHIDIRDSIINNVNRMIACKDFSYGYVFYECPNCDHYHISGLSCHSRFCASCGKIYRERRANEIAKKCLNVPHRQFVFSIAEELRIYLRLYRDLYHELFKAVDDVFVYLIQGKSKIAKNDDRELGYISFLHTFGRDLKFNPHIHVLMAERIIDNDLKFKKYDYFNFESLRKAFMNQLLKRIYHYLKENTSKYELVKFSRLRNYLYKQLKDGFYTYGPKLKNNTKVSIKNITRYIARYARHPAMSESRIINVNYDNHTITYYYDPHEDDGLEKNQKQGRQYVTESVFKFIKKLIILFPRQLFWRWLVCKNIFLQKSVI